MKFKAISPVVLIHGLGAWGWFFREQKFTNALEKKHIPYDLEIDLFKDGVVAAGKTLDKMLPEKAKELGVDSLHVVAHSKGGVDVRQYLSEFQANHNEQFRILSYTSLSTAHHGSVLGDLVIAESEFSLPGNEVRLEGFSISGAYLSLYQLMIHFTWQGNADMSTTHMSSFNLHNLALLPQDIHYNLLAADADANNNGELDIPNEMADGNHLISLAYKIEIGKWKYHHLSNAFKQMYDLLKTTKGVMVSHEVADTVDGEGLTIVKAVNFSKPVMNDIFVDEVSATADSTRLYHAARHRFTFQGPDARSHMGMLNEGVADKVIPWLLEADQTHKYGDLQ